MDAMNQIMGLPPDKLKLREVCLIDITNDRIASSDYKTNYDPSKFKSHKTGRGPLKESWQQKVFSIFQWCITINHSYRNDLNETLAIFKSMKIVIHIPTSNVNICAFDDSKWTIGVK